MQGTHFMAYLHIYAGTIWPELPN